MSEQEKNNEAAAPDPFEENLRHILSNDNAPLDRGKTSPQAAHAESTVKDVEPDLEAIRRMKAEQRTLLFFNILRPIAALALLAALAAFVTRITGRA